MPEARRPARAEVVGSLLRPEPLRRAVESFYETGHTTMHDEERAKDRGEWMKESQALVDLGAAAFKAAEAKDAEAVAKAGDEIYNVCESCHNKYMEKAKETK